PALTSANLDSTSGLLHVSTSVAYLRKRLADVGRQDLLDAAEAGLISTFAAAEEAGLVRRRGGLGTGSPNATKRGAWGISRKTQGTPAAAAQTGARARV